MKTKIIFIILIQFVMFPLTFLNVSTAFASATDYKINEMKSCDIKNIFNDSNGKVCILGISDNKAVCTQIDLSGKIKTHAIDLKYKYTASAYRNGNLYIAQNTTSDYIVSNTLLITKINLSTGMAKDKFIDEVKLFDEYSLAVSDDKLYMICDDDDKLVLKVYDHDGNKINTINHNRTVPVSVWCFNNYLYTFTNCETEIISTSNDTVIYYSEKSTNKERMISENLFIDENKCLYKLNSDATYDVLSEIKQGVDAAVLLDNGIVYSIGKTAYYYDFETNSVYTAFKSSSTIINITKYKSNIYFIAASGDTISIRTKTDKEITALSTPNSSKPLASSSKAPGNATSSMVESCTSSEYVTSNFESVHTMQEITSDIYTIEDGIIYNKNGETSVSAFKKSFDHLDMKIEIKKSLKANKTQGNIGTGNRVIFTDDYGNKQSFIVITVGDITGDGNIGKKDYEKIVEHLFSVTLLDGIYFQAADINYDDTIDLADWYEYLRDYWH